METVYGSKYQETKNLKLTEIAKRVRADLKELASYGFKFSVRCDSYSGGQELDVTIVEIPRGLKIYDRERLAMDMRNESHGGRGWMASTAAGVVAEIEKILFSYNYDGSDTMTDYFHVRFYSNVKFTSEIQQADRAAAVAEIEAAELEAAPLAKVIALTPATPAQLAEVKREVENALAAAEVWAQWETLLSR